MRMINLEIDTEREEFARRAAVHFAENSKLYTYTDGNIEPGCWFALRFGLGNDCVVVFKLDEFDEPTNYQQLIREYSV